MRNFLAGLWLLIASLPLAASPIEATFVGVNGAAAFGYYVGPYYGKLDQQSVVLDCIDFANDVHFGQQWAANLSHIDTELDLANTRFGGRAGALQLYQEAAWLTIQYSLNPSSAYADIQATIWQLFDAYAPRPSSGYWLSEAQAHYSSWSYEDFFVVTNVGPVNPTGQVQEFLTVLEPSMAIYPQSSSPQPVSLGLLSAAAAVSTPEPRLLGAIGMIVICLAALRKGRDTS
jgi:hypothetical protein